MRASVIICTYNRAELLKESIQSILEQDFPSDQFELIIVDNNSTDNTKKVVEELASTSKVKIKYVFEEKQGHSYARNAGINNADGEIVVFTDDDIEAEKTWIREIVSVFDNPDIACAGGPVLPIWPFEKPAWLDEKMYDYLAINEFKYAQKYGEFKSENSYPIGANMAFRKKIFETIGMFPTNLGRVGYSLLTNDELLPCLRIKAINKSIIFVPNAVIYHKVAHERLKKLWFYHRTYWQGRSDAILDISIKANIYARLRQYASEMIFREPSKKENVFETECFNRLVKGYLHQLVFPQEDKNIKNGFQRLRSIETFITEVLKTSAHFIKERDEQILRYADSLRQLDHLIKEKDEQIKQYTDSLRESNRLIKERDEQIRQLINSLSWRITSPLRIIHRLFIKLKIK